MVERSALGPIWLLIDGAADPVKWLQQVSMLDAKRLVAKKWAPFLVTDDLSLREMQIFLKLVDGKTVTEAAAELFMSAKTVSTYRSRILDKTGFASNVDMAKYAIRFGLIDWPREYQFLEPVLPRTGTA